MKGLIYYLLQVIITSGLLYGYYYFVLRNKKFHHYNRFYLLAATFISMLIPFLQIPVYFSEDAAPPAVLQSLNLITVNSYTDTTTVFTSTPKTNWLNWQNLSWSFYILISILFLLKIIFSLNKIRSIIRNHEIEKLDHINFVNTNEPETPFSFFRWMFWNRNIELSSEKGEQVFRHELFHIQQRHSWDIVFIELVTIVFWINPFFHLIKKELKAIHEFLADEFAVKENQEWKYAEFLLMQALNTQNSLINPFFHNQIKRRIAMITTSKKPSYQYLRKLLVLPVAAIVFILFAFSYKGRLSADLIIIKGDVKGIPDGKVYLTEAHHWNIFLFPQYDSTTITNGHFEFRINPGKEFYPYLAAIKYPDDNSMFKLSGLMFDNTHSDGFYLARGTTTIVNAGNTSPTKLPSRATEIHAVANAGRQNEVYAKFVRTDFGLSTEKRKQQLEYYKNLIKQNSFSYYFLQSIYDNRGQYSKDELMELLSLFDKEVQASKLTDMLMDYIVNGPKPEDNLISIVDTIPPPNDHDTLPELKKRLINAVIIVDGVEKDSAFLGSMDVNSIKVINVLKGDTAARKYGSKGKNGVIEIFTKEPEVIHDQINLDTVPKVQKPTEVWTKVEVEASFPGGDYAWNKFLTKNLDGRAPVINNAPNGRYTVWIKFIVDKDGSLSDFKPLTNYGFGMEAEALRVMKLSPDWNAATQKGKKVTAYRLQPITFVLVPENGNVHSSEPSKNEKGKRQNEIIVVTDNSNYVRTDVDVEASFPGGDGALKKFLKANMDESIAGKNGAAKDQYHVVMLQFIVDKEGNTSDWKALTNLGYGMEEEALRAMKKTSKWIPARRDGHYVTAYRKQSVAFLVGENPYYIKISKQELEKTTPFSLLKLQPDEEVVSFKMIIDAVGIKPQEFDLTGNYFSEEVKARISTIQIETYIYLENIKVRSSNKIVTKPPMYGTVVPEQLKTNAFNPSDPGSWNFNDPEFKRKWHDMIAEIKAIAWKEGKAAYEYKGRTYVFGKIKNPDPNVAAFTEQNGIGHVFLLNGELVTSIDGLNKLITRSDVKKFGFISHEEASKRFNRDDAIVFIETYDSYLTKK
jgi:hypothetical protein